MTQPCSSAMDKICAYGRALAMGLTFMPAQLGRVHPGLWVDGEAIDGLW